jgi:hypothetical protein
MTQKPAHLKPDLGLHRLQQGHSHGTVQIFYGVEVVDFDFVSPNLHSIMFEYSEDGVAYALSFDFDYQLMTQILGKLSPTECASFLNSIEGREFPFRAALPHPIHLNKIESYLGETQYGAHDAFVPFVITQID